MKFEIWQEVLCEVVNYGANRQRQMIEQIEANSYEEALRLIDSKYAGKDVSVTSKDSLLACDMQCGKGGEVLEELIDAVNEALKDPKRVASWGLGDVEP